MPAKQAICWYLNTAIILVAAARDREIVGSGAVNYLMYSGYVMLAHQWAEMAKAAKKKIGAAQGDEKEFLTAKLQTADFYFQYILPRTRHHAKSMHVPFKTFLNVKEEWISPIE